jgi:hypothetical protein
MIVALRAWQRLEPDERPTQVEFCNTYNVKTKSFRARLKKLVILILEFQNMK